MPTDNPKISLYVPQQIYDRFKEFQEERKLSMSQAGIVILAEYFGVEETIKEITEGTTIGGVTLTRIENLEKEVKQLQTLVNQINNTSSLLTKNRLETTSQEERTELKSSPEQSEFTNKPLKILNQNLDRIVDDRVKKEKAKVEQPQSTNELPEINTQGNKQFELIENKSEIAIRGDLLAKRLGLAHPKSLSNRRIEIYKYNNFQGDSEFRSYTQKKDFDGIGWKPIKIKNRYEYVPVGELSNELLSRLQKWIAKNQENG